MKKTDCYFYSEFYDMGAHISCCTFKEYPLGKCPCDNCTNYVPQSKVSQIVSEYLEHKAIPSAEPKTCYIEKSNFDMQQYKLDTDTAYECGYKAGLQAQADDDIIAKVIAIIEFEDAWLEDAHRHNPDTRIAFDSMIKKIRALRCDKGEK